MNNVVSVIFAICFVSLSFGQEESKKETKAKEEVASTELKLKGKAKKFKKLGDELFEQGAYYGAIEQYDNALLRTKKKKLIAKLQYQIGEGAYNVRDYEQAEGQYRKLLATGIALNKFPLIEYKLANSLKYQAKYVNAQKHYKEFVAQAGDKASLSWEKSKARLESKGCTYALEIPETEAKYIVQNIGIKVNGNYADFGPEIRGEELVFSKILKDSVDQFNSAHTAKLYVSEMQKNQYNTAELFSSVLNEGEYYVCNPSFTEDGNTVYFVKCRLNENLESNCAIYSSYIENGVWTEPILLNEKVNAPNSSNTQPQFVEFDGKQVLFFSSNRENGRGGRDIWYAPLSEEGSFGRAKNLGGTINTRYDEVSPFFNKETSTLYYSTDGELSLGGLDIYSSEWVDEEWAEPVALESPINTSLDDYDFILEPSGEFGFLVSNRPGVMTAKNSTCCDDLFEWRVKELDLFVKGLVYANNADSRALMETATIHLENLSTGALDSFNYVGEAFVMELEQDASYELLAKSNDFEDTTISFNTNNIVRSDTLEYDVFFSERKNFNQKVIGVIYYEYNQSNLTKEAPKTLTDIVSFLKTYPKTTLEIRAHTDANGPAPYNLRLSEERSKAAAKYLTFNGINEDRIVLKWFGETEPVAPNYNEDGTDNKAGRAKNRRTEFKIIE